MTANELRIGNHFSTGQGDNIAKVTPNAIEALWESENRSWIKPIPLTEEWLLKFGFDNTIFDKDIWSITSMSNKIEYIYLEKTKSLQVADGYLITIAKNVKSVHQLQNLYFALTQTEL